MLAGGGYTVRSAKAPGALIIVNCDTIAQRFTGAGSESETSEAGSGSAAWLVGPFFTQGNQLAGLQGEPGIRD